MRISANWISITAAGVCLAASPAFADRSDDDAFIQRFKNLTTIGSTVPGNGDQNPYGVAVAPVTKGNLVKGNILVSNFNNQANDQGTGSTIMQITPQGNVTVFATITQNSLPTPCPGGIGLTTALVALRSGFVVVGSLPTTGGDPTSAQAGCLIVLDSSGNPVLVVAGGDINGPWDMTAFDFGDGAVLFVTNVLNGTVKANFNPVNGGTVVRILLATPDYGKPRVLASKVIATGFPETLDKNALVIGPTGVGIGQDGKLYVADTLNNRIAAISNPFLRLDDAGTGKTVSQGKALNQPLGLAIAPNGNILTVNAGDGNIVETEREGEQVAVLAIDVSGQGGGTLFGLAVAPGGSGVYYVDDGNNTLNLLH